MASTFGDLRVLVKTLLETTAISGIDKVIPGRTGAAGVSPANAEVWAEMVWGIANKEFDLSGVVTITRSLAVLLYSNTQANVDQAQELLDQLFDRDSVRQQLKAANCIQIMPETDAPPVDPSRQYQGVSLFEAQYRIPRGT